MATKKKFSVSKEIRKLARERVGPVPAERIIVPKPTQRKAKYNLPVAASDLEDL